MPNRIKMRALAAKLQEHCRALGVPCELVYPGAPDVKHPNTDAYLIETLKK